MAEAVPVSKNKRDFIGRLEDDFDALCAELPASVSARMDPAPESAKNNEERLERIHQGLRVFEEVFDRIDMTPEASSKRDRERDIAIDMAHDDPMNAAILTHYDERLRRASEAAERLGPDLLEGEAQNAALPAETEAPRQHQTSGITPPPPSSESAATGEPWRPAPSGESSRQRRIADLEAIRDRITESLPEGVCREIEESMAPDTGSMSEDGRRLGQISRWVKGLEGVIDEIDGNGEAGGQRATARARAIAISAEDPDRIAVLDHYEDRLFAAEAAVNRLAEPLSVRAAEATPRPASSGAEASAINRISNGGPAPAAAKTEVASDPQPAPESGRNVISNGGPLPAATPAPASEDPEAPALKSDILAPWKDAFDAARPRGLPHWIQWPGAANIYKLEMHLVRQQIADRQREMQAARDGYAFDAGEAEARRDQEMREAIQRMGVDYGQIFQRSKDMRLRVDGSRFAKNEDGRARTPFFGRKRDRDIAGDPVHGVRFASLLLTPDQQSSQLINGIARVSRDAVETVDGGRVVANDRDVMVQTATKTSIALAINEARQRGWETLDISGTPKFCQEVIAEMKNQGIGGTVTVRNFPRPPRRLVVDPPVAPDSYLANPMTMPGGTADPSAPAAPGGSGGGAQAMAGMNAETQKLAEYLSGLSGAPETKDVNDPSAPVMDDDDIEDTLAAVDASRGDGAPPATGRDEPVATEDASETGAAAPSEEPPADPFDAEDPDANTTAPSEDPSTGPLDTEEDPEEPSEEDLAELHAAEAEAAQAEDTISNFGAMSLKASPAPAPASADADMAQAETVEDVGEAEMQAGDAISKLGMLGFGKKSAPAPASAADAKPDPAGAAPAVAEEAVRWGSYDSVLSPSSRERRDPFHERSAVRQDLDGDDTPESDHLDPREDSHDMDEVQP